MADLDPELPLYGIDGRLSAASNKVTAARRQVLWAGLSRSQLFDSARNAQKLPRIESMSTGRSTDLVGLTDDVCAEVAEIASGIWSPTWRSPGAAEESSTAQ